MTVGILARPLFCGAPARPSAFLGVTSVRRNLPLGRHGQAVRLADRFSSWTTVFPSINRSEASRSCFAKPCPIFSNAAKRFVAAGFQQRQPPVDHLELREHALDCFRFDGGLIEVILSE